MAQKSWEDFADNEVLGWLLEPSYPSIRYYTLRRLLDRTDDRDLIAARKAILTEGPAAEILARQRPDAS